MFECWSPAYVEEENYFLFDNFDPMKLQNSSDLNNTSIEPHELHCSGVEREQKDQILESSIDVKMEKVSLVDIIDGGQGEVGLEEKEGGSYGDMMCVKPGLEDLKSELPNKEGIFDGESDEEGSTSLESESDNGDSSSDASSSDESMSAAESLSSSEDEDGVGMKRRETSEEFEEGEVREFDAHMIDFLSDAEVEGSKGPIRSKNEVEDLPPVPMVKVTLQASHQLLPVGVISSIMGNRVIIEGSVLHNPLNEGSILWVMDTRLPLGLVDEIFGPVKNPYYIVRYNTEEEVPAGIRVGVAIAFVAEFASQILNDKELYRKGYDASGENDEEVDNEVEFSDDEKEAECKKSLREGKSAVNQCKGVKQARFKGKRNNLMRPRTQHKDIRKRPSCGQLSMYQPHPTGLMPPQPAPLTSQSGIIPGSWSSRASATNADLIPPPTMPQYPQAIQGFNYLGNPSHQLLTQHQETPGPPGYSPLLQNTGLQGDHSMQLQYQNVVLNNIVNMMAFQQLIQQFVSHQGSNLPWVGAAPSLQPLGQNNFAPSPFSNGFTNVPGTPGLGNEIIQGQASLTPGLGNEIIQGQASLPFPPSVQFNGGSSTSHFNGGSSWPHGRRPYQRGGGRLFDRGGRQPNR
ncbi:H/ACA ribonucleoprotein complex non-core subunit NAF1-like [Phalaenopsis equestris]|uniref:H/ACA ribonucleoprotein complex non-core subunit NAF1-like n=1 Tax=Phalaenopsis equestris TaxID=78828 RepID=UPI0009E5D589|nr:H/ACA ribonucleoprotein complex non-core subunit NAF1-like [Phalaenopsis equestris]